MLGQQQQQQQQHISYTSHQEPDASSKHALVIERYGGTQLHVGSQHAPCFTL